MNDPPHSREWTERQATDLLTGRILSGIHSGHLNVGDRLATYREVAEETGLDLRAVARVYRRLQEEGLVEVRGRQGVFVAAQERIGGDVLAETARWTVGILREAWTRRIEIQEFPQFVRNCIATTEVRCACIESTEDQLHTMCIELQRDFGFKAFPIHADRLVPPHMERPLAEGALPELERAHFVVTTTFHAGEARRIADALEKPLIVIRLNPDIVRDLERRLALGEVTVICVDPRFLDRIRFVVGTELAGRLRGVLVDDERSIERLHPDGSFLISHAARERIGRTDLPSIFLGSAVLSAASAEELIEILLRFNLDAIKQKK